LKAENDKYQVLLRNAKSTEKVIVKEIAQPQVSQTVTYHQEPIKTYHQEPLKTYHQESKTTYHQAPQTTTTYHQAPQTTYQTQSKTTYEPLKTEMKQVSYINDAPVK